MPRRPFIAVYIMANIKNGTLYIGVTSNLPRRVWEHKEGLGSRFADTYGCTKLVWYQQYQLIAEAIRREKTLKRWYRRWKIDLIETDNAQWRDLYPQLC